MGLYQVIRLGDYIRYQVYEIYLDIVKMQAADSEDEKNILPLPST